MKRKIAVLGLALAMAMPSLAFAENEITVSVNGVQLEMDQSPVIENGRTMVPLRAIAEALGCQVVWNDVDKTASFEQGEVTAIVTVGEQYIIVGDGVYNEEFPIDSPAVIMNGRTMIPLRALSECFGYEVSWDAETRAVGINTKSMDSADTEEANEQEAIEVADNMVGKVDAYSQILKGTVEIIDAVEYESESYSEMKNELDEILKGYSNMTYDELVGAFSKLKELDESLADVANDAGVSEVVANYYGQVGGQLSEILSE